MKILLVSSSFFPKIDGSTRCVYDHARKLVERGHVVYLVTRGVNVKQAGSFGTGKYEELEGIKILRSGVSLRSSTHLGGNKVRLALEQIWIILGLQRKERFNVMHAHGYSACYSALPCKFIFRLPLVITTHGTELLWPKSVRWKSPLEVELGLLFEKIALNFCNIIVAQSAGVKRYMLRIYGNHLSKKIRLIPTGVDHVKFRVQEKSVQEPRILFAGALSEIKGVTSLIKAFSKVHERFSSAQLVLAGSGPSMNHYKKMVKKMNLEHSVIFLGAVRDDAEMIEQYGNSDVVVLPSNVGGPISCTILEGLSSGRPVISTNVPGGIPDVINDRVGALIQPEDVDTLSQDLIRILSDNAYRENLGRNARREIEQYYTLDSMIDKLTKLYEEIQRT